MIGLTLLLILDSPEPSALHSFLSLSLLKKYHRICYLKNPKNEVQHVRIEVFHVSGPNIEIACSKSTWPRHWETQEALDLLITPVRVTGPHRLWIRDYTLSETLGEADTESNLGRWKVWEECEDTESLRHWICTFRIFLHDNTFLPIMNIYCFSRRGEGA